MAAQERAVWNIPGVHGRLDYWKATHWILVGCQRHLLECGRSAVRYVLYLFRLNREVILFANKSTVSRISQLLYQLD
jgi:hypothetical protein